MSDVPSPLPPKKSVAVKRSRKRLMQKQPSLPLAIVEKPEPPVVIIPPPRKSKKHSFWKFMLFAKPDYQSFGPEFWELQGWCVLVGIILAVIINATGIHWPHLK